MVTSYDIATVFLEKLDAPVTEDLKRAVSIWLAFESGHLVYGNNPWNLHSGPACSLTQGYCPGQGSLPGQIGNRYAGTGDTNVAVFDTLENGIAACANNLINLSPNYGYDVVIRTARAGDANGFLLALQNSSWAASHYGYSKLTGAFALGASYLFDISFTNYGNETQVLEVNDMANITDILLGYTATITSPIAGADANIRPGPSLSATIIRHVPTENWNHVIGWCNGDIDPDNSDPATNTKWLVGLDNDGTPIYTAYSNVSNLTAPVSASNGPTPDQIQQQINDAVAAATANVQQQINDAVAAATATIPQQIQDAITADRAKAHVGIVYDA